jgi:hypothetical protein
MFLRALISILLVAVSLPVVYGNDEINISVDPSSDSGEYIDAYPADGEIDYTDISDNGGSEDFSETNSSDAVADIVETYSEKCEKELNWDIGALVDSFMDGFEGFPDW